MAYGARNTANDANYRKCHGCETRVYWRDGDYCPSCVERPERRCLDCGRTSRVGTLDYAYPEQPEGWVQYREAEGFEREWAPKRELKEVGHAYRDMVKTVTVGPCLYCESTNIARLEFGMDRLPEGQRTCTAWPKELDTWHGSYTVWLKKAIGDPGITLKACASCHQPLATLKASGKMFGERTSTYGLGIRESKIELPDGKWKYSAEYKVHTSCPDPVFEAVTEPNSIWGDLVTYRPIDIAA